MRALSDEMEAAETRRAQLEEAVRNLLLEIPNLPDAQYPRR
jgi:seryl-tRNA synthetase